MKEHSDVFSRHLFVDSEKICNIFQHESELGQRRIKCSAGEYLNFFEKVSMFYEKGLLDKEIAKPYFKSSLEFSCEKDEDVKLLLSFSTGFESTKKLMKDWKICGNILDSETSSE